MKTSIVEVIEGSGYTIGSNKNIRPKTFRERLSYVPRETLKNAVESSTTWAEVAKKIGVYRINSQNKSPYVSPTDVIAIGELCEAFAIDCSHVGRKFKHSKPPLRHRVESGMSVEEIIEAFFSENPSKDVCWATRTRLLREYNLLPSQCSECGISSKWNGRPLLLQIDHINGVRNDNRIENLRTLCPNCHSQTDTYCSKNKKTPHMMDLITQQKV